MKQRQRVGLTLLILTVIVFRFLPPQDISLIQYYSTLFTGMVLLAIGSFLFMAD